MELLEAFHIPLYEFDDYEADDIIGTLARKADAKNVRVEIISGDLDMLQIVDNDIHMYQLKRGFSDVQKFDIAAIEEKYGLKKSQFLDLKSLKGDSSDNIPGVPGIGEKGAIKLLQEYETLDNLYNHVDEIPGATGQKLKDGKELAYISKQLAQIQFDAPVEFDPNGTKLADFNPDDVLAVLKKYQFNSLVAKFKKIFPNANSTPIVAAKSEQKPEKNVVKPTTKYSLPEPKNIDVEIPENLYISKDVKSSMHDNDTLAKEIIAGRPYWDLGQVDFLLDPLARKTDQLELVVSDEKEDYVKQRQQLAAVPELERIATEFDLPLIPVLFKMEQEGIKIDRGRFDALAKEFSSELAELEKEIHELAGQSFNINSPIQLSEILFDKLALPTKGIKKLRAAILLAPKNSTSSATSIQSSPSSNATAKSASFSALTLRHSRRLPTTVSVFTPPLPKTSQLQVAYLA